jgi:RNA polymerase sigma factor (sigma-70 family)
MYNDPPVAPLLESAKHGSEAAWRDLVNRYAPLVFTVCHRFQLNHADAEDVCGSVWLRLLTYLEGIREPEALPGWLKTTARHECLLLLRHKNRQIPSCDLPVEDPTEPEPDTKLIAEERHAAARHALSDLPHRDQKLLWMLFSDPPRSYQEISSTLKIPIGAIGPTRARCLTKARRTPAISALLDSAA